MSSLPAVDSPITTVRIAIIGAGFAGIAMGIRLKQAGIDDFVLLERADDLGGTWRDNTYPGCRCDVPSHLYSYSFAANPDWSSTFSPQPEIWDYLRRCADEHDVGEHIRYGHEVIEAAWDDEARCWWIETTAGPFEAQLLVSAAGALSDPSLPDIPGLDRFEGTAFHSATWDHDHDLTGERVAVIGTGASAIQFVPQIQPRVGRLTLFQRTPPWILPRPDRPLTKVEHWLYRHLPFTQRLMRSGIYWAREAMVVGMVKRPRLMKGVERLARAQLRRQVPDGALRRKLTPDFRIGCKRILISDDYYPALTRDNVEVVTDGIREVTPRGVITADGAEHVVDTIIFGTGFHVTDSAAARHVRGGDGRLLGERWQGSPRAYLGTTVAGFPNLFLIVGPNTGLGHSSMVFMIESQAQYVIDALRVMDEHDAETVEVRPEVQARFNAELDAGMSDTVWTSGCASWYLDEAGRNSTLWPDFTFAFRRRTRRFDPADYTLRSRRSGSPTAAPTERTPVAVS